MPSLNDPWQNTNLLICDDLNSKFCIGMLFDLPVLIPQYSRIPAELLLRCRNLA